MATPENELGNNLSDAAAALAGDGDLAGTLPSRAGRRAKAAGVDTERRVKIMLEDNDQIPPTGQFISINGRTFMLQSGVEVEVPECVLDVLDHAIMSVPVVDGTNSVVGYRDRLRFPYRVIREGRTVGMGRERG